MMTSYKTTKDHLKVIATGLMVFSMALTMIGIGVQAYDYGYEKGQASVKGTYLTPSVQDVDIQCMAWLFDVGAAQAKSRICKK